MRPRAGWMGLNDKKLRELGIDFFGQKLEWMPQVRHTYGGIVADLDGSTAIKGLYAAGLARNPDPGVYMGGWGDMHHGDDGLFGWGSCCAVCTGA